MRIKLEKGIPLPPRGGKMGAFEQALTDMAVGDSFECLKNSGPAVYEAKKRMEAKGIRREIATRTNKADPKLLRVWRVK